jgi:hypothetical protein
LIPARVIDNVDIQESGKSLKGMVTKKSENGKKIVQGTKVKNNVLSPILHVTKPVGKDTGKMKGQHGSRDGPVVETAIVVKGNPGKLKKLRIGRVEWN